MIGKVKIVSEKQLFDGYLKVWEGKVCHTSDRKTVEYTREKLVREDAVTVLLYHAENQTVILVSQLRYPIVDREAKPPLETLAGKMDQPDETPVNTAIREIEEEVGFKVQEAELIHLTDYYSSSGYTSEKVYVYFSKVSEAMRVHKGGGKADEQEFIEVVELPVSCYFEEIYNGKIKDAKTIIAGLLARGKGLL